MFRIDSPIGIVIDSLEGIPWEFDNITADRWMVDKNKKLLKSRGLDPKDEYLLDIPITTQHLPEADYCILDPSGEVLDQSIVIERKSPSDLVQALTTSREREQRKIARMNEHPIAFWVVECLEHELPYKVPESDVNWKTLSRTRISWSIRYNRVNWVFQRDRQRAATFCFRALELYWRKRGEFEQHIL